MRKFVQKKLTLVILFCMAAICSFSQLASNKGKEFWVGYGHHIYMESDNSMTMVIYLSAEEQAADVTVTVDSSGVASLPPANPTGAGPWQRTYHIEPYTAVSTEPMPENNPWDSRLWQAEPAQGGLAGAAPMAHKGIHIVSTAPITAYAHIYGGAASGATMLMPVTTWGYEYTVLSSNQSYQSNTCSWMYVIAAQDNTVIEVTPSVKTKHQEISGLSPGVTKTYTLMKGHILQIRGANIDSDGDGNNGTSSEGFQLSGTKVKSVSGASGQCKPIAVFAGSSRTLNVISCGSGGGDNDNQQLFPMHAWGKRYLTVPFSPSGNVAGAQTSMVRVAFSEPPPATQLKKNGVAITLPAGSSYYTYESSTADLLEASKPIMVNQFMTGGTCAVGNLGDPEMVVVAPVEQAIKQVVFYRNDRQNIDTNYVTLIVPTEGLASLRIDNSTAFDYTYPHPRNSLMGRNYTVVIKKWKAVPAQCRIKCDSAFNAITYGLGSVESYAYSAGAQVVNLNALPGIHNQPDTSNGGKNIHQYTGVGTPMDLSVLIKYKPDKLTWKFNEMSPVPGSCLSISPSFTGNYVMDPASTYLVDSIIINSTKYYKYKLPQTYTFNCAGIYELPLEAYSPGLTNCGSTEYFSIYIEVKEKPVVDFSYTHPTQCTKDTLYLTGPEAGLSGVTPLSLLRWKWLLPGGITGYSKDTGVIIAPGTYDIKLTGVTDQGLLTDTVSKSITVYPPPVTVITATPESVCIGQSITLNQSASYPVAGIGIENYYWNLDEGPSTIFNDLTTTKTHTYAAPGDYTVQAAVRISPLCVSDTATLLVPITPEAKIDFTFPTGCLPASGLAQFNASAVDWGGFPIVSYNWNFGDGPGSTSTAQNPTHTYASQGTYPVTLNIVNSTGCAGDTTVNIAFAQQPLLAYPALTAVCANASPLSVGTASVTNGVAGTGSYSGPGITDPVTGTFDPALAGPGTHTITYTYTTPSCAETKTQTITVNPLPAVSAGNYIPVCINATPVILTGSPAGGTFTGTAITGTTFNPATAGAGTFPVSYSYTDANGCSNTSAPVSIVVNPLPVVNAGTYNAVCINAASITLNGTPLGGTFNGTGVTGNSFDPATAGAGTFPITYSYTDGNGCSNTSSATNIVVNALPIVNAGTYNPLCKDAAPVTLTGTPAGGTFSGTGVTGNTFDPSAVIGGTYSITYSYTDANGCSNISSPTAITVNTLPTVSIGALNPVCANATAVTLMGTPAGGTFTGTGVTGNTFNPSTAGAGTFPINYSYTDANGCSNTATPVSITVNALPTVTIGSLSPVCINAASVTLTGTPAGGTFTGTGVTGNTFNPSTAGAGTFPINYSYTDANGCSNTATPANITVNPLPVVNAGTYGTVCISTASVTLTGTPAGGTFSGPGVTGNTFSPATAGFGTHTINYSYTDPNGCSNTAPPTTITVNSLPVVDAGTYNALCASSASITLVGTPAGGTFSGPGVTGNTFNPAAAGPGSHSITYNYSDGNGCSGSDPVDIVVNALPTVTIGSLNPVCINAAAVTLTGSPAGGTFSGTGVTGNSFDPAAAGAGTHAINYSYTDANGCSNTAAPVNITVNTLPVVNAGTYNAVCLNASPVTLTGTPAGGTFSGTGITGTSFNPATAGTGTYTVNYSYTDANGCSNTAAPTTITVNALPSVDAGTYNAVCIDAATINLAGTPAGGTFSGPGVTGNIFYPSTAGAGTKSVTYTYTDANGCSNTDPATITVNALPAVTIGALNAVCINAAAVTLTGSPAGGTFSGPGVTGNTFDPAAAGVGSHTINYSYTDANGCSNTATPATLAVNALPVVNAGTYNDVCLNAAAVTLTGTPAGGTFSGPGVTGNTFNPGTAGTGTHTINYSYTDANGCSNTAPATSITVNTIPTVDAGTYAAVCENAATVTLVGTPAGGTFSGPGVTGNYFDPAAAGAGIKNITYTYADAGGCSNTGPATITVNALPTVTLSPLNPVCIDADPLTLTGTPAGGTFSGTGVTGTIFYPNTAGAGTHPINYSYTDANGCSNTASPVTIVVNPQPVLDAGTYNAVCIDGAPITLTGTPAGGTFSGPGVTGNTFNPATAGAGNGHVITYGGVNGCKNTITTSITVRALPVVNAAVNIPIPLCVNESPIMLTGTPAGGTFSGPGVSGDEFDPSKAGAGDHQVKYTYTDAYGCTNSDLATYIVKALPVIDAGSPIVVPEGTVVRLGATVNAGGYSYSWDPPYKLSDPYALNPTLTATEDQIYTLTVTSATCTVTDVVTVKILKPVKVPNAFSPNGDGIHDTWVIPNLADYPGSTVEVFNRYGQRVFYSSGYGSAWDGKLNGKAIPVGVYYYVIQLNNGFKPLSGSLTILK